MRAFSGASAAVLGQTHMLPLSTQMPFPLKMLLPCSMQMKGTEEFTHGMHCCVGLHDLMGILRVLCDQVVAGLHDVLKVCVLKVICSSLNV